MKQQNQLDTRSRMAYVILGLASLSLAATLYSTDLLIRIISLAVGSSLLYLYAYLEGYRTARNSFNGVIQHFNAMADSLYAQVNAQEEELLTKVDPTNKHSIN